MNAKKLNQLFAAARKEPAPVPAPDFAADVLRAVRREPETESQKPFSVFDQLNLLFPRLALAAVVVIVLCVAADYGLAAAGGPGTDDGTEPAAQFLFNTEDI